MYGNENGGGSRDGSHGVVAEAVAEAVELLRHQN